MDKRNLKGEFKIVLEKSDNETKISEKYSNGLIKISPTIHLDSEKIPAYFILGLGGGYVEGEKYKNEVIIKKGGRSIITTQAATKVYKCLKENEKTEQETIIKIEDDSILEYVTDSVILYEDAIYKQETDIYMDKDSTLIYSDGITAGWSKCGENFKYKSAQLKTKLYVEEKLVLLDNLLVNPREEDITGLGYFEGYKNLGTLIAINKNISKDIVETLRKDINNLNLPIYFGISMLEVNGFVLRVLGNLTQDIEKAILVCHNYIRKEFLGSRNLSIRKY